MNRGLRRWVIWPEASRGSESGVFQVGQTSGRERRLEGQTYKKIAKNLGLTEYHMENCAKIVRLMEAAGLPEPCSRLREKPDQVPQWCSKHWLKAGERKGGGRRRRAS